MSVMDNIHEFAKDKAGTIIALCFLCITIGGFTIQIGKEEGRLDESTRRISLLEEQTRQLATKSELGDQYRDTTRRLDRIEDKVDNIARENGITVRSR